MEKEKIKISFSAIVLIIAILITIICCLSYKVTYLTEQLESNPSDELDKKYVKGLSAGLAESNDYGYFGENYIKGLEVLLAPSDGSNEFGDPSIVIYAPDSASLGISSIEIDQNGDAYANIPKGSQLYEKYGKTTKIASKIIDAAICHEGNGDYYNVYMLQSDGKVLNLTDSNKHTNISFSGELLTEPVENLNDIVKMFSVNIGNADQTIFVDISGDLLDVNGKGIE